MLEYTIVMIGSNNYIPVLISLFYFYKLYFIKLIFISDGGVGKTSIVTQLTQNQFTEQYDPTIEDNFKTKITVDGEQYLLASNILINIGYS
ncbi:hypothetical protein HZS_7227 [Henneguya salminicola]|nr:hypothetical protein HZS_7227 [Henneguya salminicola]